MGQDTRFESLADDSHAQSEYLLRNAVNEKRKNQLDSEIHNSLRDLSPLPHNRPSWSDALKSFGGPILTFNYDDVLELCANRRPVAADRFCCESTPSLFPFTVLHLHGTFTDGSSIVLDQASYIKAARNVPDMLLELSRMGYVFVYAGVGAALSDPDLNSFWLWEDIDHKVDTMPVANHFLLCKGDDVPPLFNRQDMIVRNFFARLKYTDHALLPSIVGDVLQHGYADNTVFIGLDSEGG